MSKLQCSPELIMTDWEKASITGVVQCNSAVSLYDLAAASADCV